MPLYSGEDVISCFAQTSDHNVLMASKSFILQYNRRSRNVIELAGSRDCCQNDVQLEIPASEDFRRSKFYQISSIVAKLDSPNQFYVADQLSIRLLDLQSKRVKRLNFSCIYENVGTDCKYLAMESSTVMYIAGRKLLVKFDLSINTFTFLQPSSSPVSYSYSREIQAISVLVAGKTLLLADRSLLRVYNLLASKVTNICNEHSEMSSDETDINRCTLSNPQALLKWNSSLVLIATEEGFYKLYSKFFYFR